MKTLVIDAIVGGGFPNPIVAAECENVGLATSHLGLIDTVWDWKREALEECELSTLQELYEALREKRGCPITQPEQPTE